MSETPITSSSTFNKPLTLVGEGFRSTIYRSADDILLRAPKNSVAQASQQDLQLTLTTLAPLISTLEIPKPSVLIEPSEEFPFGALGYKEIEGSILSPSDITPENQDSIAQQLAAFLHELHSINPAALKSKVELQTSPDSVAELQNMWELCAPYIQRKLDVTLYSPITSWYQSAFTYLSSMPSPTGLIHGDFWHENIIYDGEKVAGVIDFEYVGLGSPVADIMTLETLGDSFVDAVIKHYSQLNPGFTFDKRLANILMGIRELEGLAYGIETDAIDKDQLEKIIRATKVGT